MKKKFGSAITMAVRKLNFLHLTVCAALLPAVVLGVVVPVHNAAALISYSNAADWVGNAGCKFDGPGFRMNLSDIRPYEGVQINTGMGWSCGSPTSPASAVVKFIAACGLFESANWEGNTRAMVSADGKNKILLRLIDTTTGEELGARQTAVVGNIMEAVSNVGSITTRNAGFYQAMTVIVPPGQTVPGGRYVANLTLRVWWVTDNSPVMPAGFNCASQIATPNFIELTGTVEANVPASCDVAATDVDFGTHLLLDQDITGRSLLKTACTAGTPYRLKVSTGDNYPADQKRLKSADGTQYITYGIYTHGDYTTPWTPDFSFSDIGSGITEKKWYVYLKVPKQSRAGLKAGTYSDTITVNIEY